MEKKEKKRFSVRMKMNVFVVITVLLVALGTSTIAFRTSVEQINAYYKQSASDNARNFASMVDGDYLARLRAAAETPEYQELRARAEEEDNEALIEEYLKEHDLWEEYEKHRRMITDYLNNMEGIKYLYLTANGDKDADHDMYLIDDETIELYETGYYEQRETELKGLDIANLPEPTISHGDWGWLCSDFKPVYDSQGNCVCVCGCDFAMDDVMKERRTFLIYLIAGSLIFTAVILTLAMIFINRIVVKPIDAMTSEMKKFKPSEHLSYVDAGVIDLDIRSHDEIYEIYNGIRSMQIDIIDYLRDMSALQEDKDRVESDLKDKEKQIGKLSVETYKDALTHVGNKTAYVKKVEELNRQIEEDDAEFALVMIDMNNLKQVNDDHGHKAGDQYIKGCCHMVCDAFKHSPVFRIGGDEFVVILEGTDYENRIDIVKRLKDEFKTTYGRDQIDPWLRYSAAVGLAERASDDTTVELIFKRADKAMYEDKARFKEEHGFVQSR